MKIKCRPEDFQVEELLGIEPGPDGPFRLYRLTKTGMGTPEALEAIRHRWNLASRQVSYGGLKDRHARTIQYLTIQNGPDRSMEQSSFALEWLGRSPRPYGAASFRGNRFVLVIRDLSAAEAGHALGELLRIRAEGLPNYFDDQRFGSLGESGEFIGGAWLRGDHERALFLALAEPNPMDRPSARQEKALVREHWTQWAQAKERLPRSSARSIVTYLVDHPEDFKGAFARLNRDMRALWFSAFQSHLWNLLLARAIRELTRPGQCIDYGFKAARMPIYHDLDPAQIAELRGLELPLPSARTPKPDAAPGAWIDEVLDPFGLSWEQLRVKGLKDVFLSKGTRPAVLTPAGVEGRVFDDELYPRRKALELRFELPRGAYATILVKRLGLGDE